MGWVNDNYFRKNEKIKSIHVCEWPKLEKAGKTDEFDLLVDILGKVRQAKSQANKSMKAEILLSIEKKDKNKLREMLNDLQHVTNAKEIKEGKFKVELV